MRTDSPNKAARRGYAIFCGVLLLVLDPAAAQIGSGSSAAPTTSSYGLAGVGFGSNGTAASPAGGTLRTIHGQVVNAMSGLAIPRALVNLNTRQVLTDSQGKFEFPQFSEGQASVRASKPGYSASADGSDIFAQRQVADLDALIELKLYPNAVVTGIVSAPDSQPLRQVQVTLRRANYDANGLRWVNAGNAMTNSHGEYRISAPSGRYRVSLGYQQTRETGDPFLPESFPEESTSNRLGYFTLAAGEEKQIDLRPRPSQAYPVLVKVDQAQAGQGEPRPNIRFTAMTSTGHAFYVNSANGTAQGEYKLELPSGTYILRARSESREEAMEGASRVTLAGHPVSGVVLHLTPIASLPIEVDVDPASAPQNVPTRLVIQLGTVAPSMPTAQMFNLFLHNLAENGEGINQDVMARPREDKSFEFRVPPGRYRLQANGGGSWYVESASYGGITNLLTSDIVIGDGSAGAPIRIVANNQRGTVHGSINLAAAVTGAWVYFFPKSPALNSPNPTPAGSDGSFSVNLPVGSYLAVALASRVLEDLRDSEVIARLTEGARTVEVAASADSTIQLDLSQPREPVQ